MKGICAGAATEQFLAKAVGVGPRTVTCETTPSALDYGDGQSTDRPTEQAFSDDANDDGFIEWKPIEHPKLRPGNQGHFIRTVQIRVQKHPARHTLQKGRLDWNTGLRNSVVGINESRSVKGLLMGQCPVEGLIPVVLNRTRHGMQQIKEIHGAVFFWIAPTSMNHRAPAGSVGRWTFHLLDALQR